MPPRTLSLILSLWLFFSAFAWPRTPAEFTNAWLGGLVAALLAVAGMKAARARHASAALAAWLLVAAAVLTHRHAAARWNDAALALGLLLLSLVPGTARRRGRAATV